MKKTLYLPLSLIILVVLTSCQSSTESKNPVPEKVRIVEKSPEDAPDETGIDAETLPPNIQTIYLEWYPVKDEDLVAYDIYRSVDDSVGNFAKYASVEKTLGVVDTFFYDKNVQPFKRYYYYIVARDEIGQEGERSSTIDYELLPPPEIVFPTGIANQTGEFTFQWNFSSADVPPNQFVFRLQRKVGSTNINYFIKLFPLGTDYSPHQEWSFSQLGLSYPLPTGTYRWRIDVVGSKNNQGAESAWQTFFIQ